jgi:hypothetical protein
MRNSLWLIGIAVLALAGCGNNADLPKMALILCRRRWGLLAQAAL